MFPGIAENVDEEIGATVHHLRLIAELRVGVHHAQDLDDPFDAVEAAEIRPRRGEDVETDLARRLVPLLDGQVATEFPGRATRARAVTRDEKQTSDLHRSHVIRDRRRRRRQFDPQLFQSVFSCHTFPLLVLRVDSPRLLADGSLPGESGQRGVPFAHRAGSQREMGESETTSSRLIETLIELMELPGPTGQEEPVLAWCRNRWAQLGADVRVTPIGNVLAHVPGNGPKLLLQGHADEIGFVVKSIDGRGFVWLDNGQGGGGRFFHDRYPVGQPALVIGRRAHVPGLFATATGHILTTRPQEPGRLATNDLFVDVGASSRAQAEALGVHVGAGVIWNPPTRRLGHRLFGKAVDDRVSLALMTYLLEAIDRGALAYDLTVAATVQEEIGLVGASSLASPTDFDLAIAIDNGPIGDYPGIDPREMPVILGLGPTLVYKDGWVHYDRRIIEQLRDLAFARDVPIQESTYPGFGSDGAQLIKLGIPTALLGISTRYTHSAFEMVDERDVEASLELLKAFVTTPASPLPLGPS